MSAALLSSPVLRSASGSTADIFMEIATSIESILLSLLFYRSGLIVDSLSIDSPFSNDNNQDDINEICFCLPGLSFLLVQPEATELIILSLRDAEDTSKKECMALRQAAVFLSKGFFCHPQEVGMIIELHLKVVSLYFIHTYIHVHLCDHACRTKNSSCCQNQFVSATELSPDFSVLPIVISFGQI